VDIWNERMLAVAERRDKQAFALIFDHFAPRLETYLQRQGMPRDEAEDIAQDVLTTVWVKSALFDPQKSSLATWIYRIARNRRIDRLRRARSFLPLEETDIESRLVETVTPDSALVSGQEAQALKGAMIELPEEQRQLVQLSYFEGMSQSEIAAHARLPLGTVKSRLRLAFNRLRLSLTARGVSGYS
jgi:RNA polymerase sigma-70 factor (ECF subfamily)